MDWNEIKKQAAIAVKNHPIDYKRRLIFEFQEIERQAATIYWERLIEDNLKFDDNKNGLVLPFLLDITPIDPIINDTEHNIEYHPDFPDIDVDFVGDARSLIKKYVSDKYGVEYVCSVGLWQRYAMKLAMQDVARALGEDVNSVIKINKTLPEEIDNFTLEQILSDKEFQSIIDYYEEDDTHKKIVETAYRMKSLIKSHGRHAGGFIISNVPVGKYIPLDKKGDDWVTEWTEGQSTQLSKFGFIKFDFLGLKTLHYIWAAKQIIKEKYGVTIDWFQMDFEKNCGGMEIYSDGTEKEISFSDEKCLQLIEDGHMETIFQFDTPLARRILKNKVKEFKDILVFTSLGRPGPLPYVETYVKRRDGKEELPPEIHPEITKILEETLQVIVYQEQLTEIWKKVAGFTAPEAEAARKAVAKKWADKLKFVKKKWLDGASPSLGRETAEEMYKRMETFGRYAFNKCLTEDTVLYDPVIDEYMLIGEAIFEVTKGKEVHSYCYSGGEIKIDRIKDIFYTGKKLIFKVIFSNGGYLKCTLDHKFLSKDEGFVAVSDAIYDDIALITNGQSVQIMDVERIGYQDTFSLEMCDESHNYLIPFINSKGMIVSANSHAVAYSLIIFRTLYLKSHYSSEWWSAVLTNCNLQRQADYIKAMREEGIKLLTLDINNLSLIFTPGKDGVTLGLNGVKGIGRVLIEKLKETYKPPYETFDDFCKEFGSKILIERLVKLGAFDEIEPNRKLLWYWYNYKYNRLGNNEIKKIMKAKFGWPKNEILKERKKLENEFLLQYPNRKRIPNKILNWLPTTSYEGDSLNDEEIKNLEFIKMSSKINIPFELLKKEIQDFSEFERLAFQKEYLGYYLDSPLIVYETTGYNIEKAKKEGILECIIENYRLQTSKSGKSTFFILYVNDGVNRARVNVWESDISANKSTIKSLLAVKMAVTWSSEYESFSLVRGTQIKPLDSI